MSSRVLFSGGVEVDFQQFYVASPEYSPDFDEAFRGQSNGICGAAKRGGLWLTTGLHVGLVQVQVTLHDTMPELKDDWEEVVECPFEGASDRLLLKQWGEADGIDLSLPRGSYRVRYSARSMLGDWQMRGEETPTQFYSLQFWPATARPDAILRVTGECARNWHSQIGGKSEV